MRISTHFAQMTPARMQNGVAIASPIHSSTVVKNMLPPWCSINFRPRHPKTMHRLQCNDRRHGHQSHCLCDVSRNLNAGQWCNHSSPKGDKHRLLYLNPLPGIVQHPNNQFPLDDAIHSSGRLSHLWPTRLFQSLAYRLDDSHTGVIWSVFPWQLSHAGSLSIASIAARRDKSRFFAGRALARQSFDRTTLQSSNYTALQITGTIRHFVL
jgi:hypothetical protein